MSRISPLSKCCHLALLAFLGCNVPIETEESRPEPDLPAEDPSVVWTNPLPPRNTPPSSPEYEAASPSPEPIGVRLERELVVVDPAVVNGPEASLAEPGAPLSFRTLLTWLIADERQTLIAAREWLGQWGLVTQVGAAAAPVSVRPDVVTSLIDPWFDVPETSPLGYSRAPTGTETEEEEEEESLWARTPFELLAVVNRIDLATGTCSGSAGELRFVYAAVSPLERRPLEMTLIVEVPYPDTRSPAAWANAWHELAGKSAAEYASGLASLAHEVTRDADPLRVRLRTNEAALGASQHLPWELREFRLAASEQGRRLVMTPLEQTPRTDLDPTTLAAAINERARQVIQGSALLPIAMRAGAAQVPVPTFTWTIPGVDVALRRAFSQQTCNGCHGGEARALPFQHIAPSLDGGPARLSRFLRNPDAPSDELRRRADIYASLLRSECAEPTPGAGGYAAE